MDNIVVDLMLEFLKNAFPLERLKFGKKFKLGVDVDGTRLNLPKDSLILFSKIYDSLKGCYDASDDDIRYTIRKYYRIS